MQPSPQGPARPAPIDAGALVSATDEQVSAHLTGETVILSMRDGMYYGLDEVGTVVWQRIQRPTPFAELVQAVVAQFEVEAPVAETDLTALVRDLAAHGLAEVRPTASP
ncbi:MAG: PqqD family peptide modification chaperone [Gemmatimonadales bacterium]|nr:PqqD family protein [Gemmatimonadota bacterium]MCL4213749.1 PqqD family peptide modification chaperone [Gemmatimonadales bacterium]